jgi:hypothetical protein
MGNNSFGHGIVISHIYRHAEWCADAIPLASTLYKMINNSFTQSILYVPVELELLAWGTIPWALALALALATSVDMLRGVPILFHWPPHYTKQ